MTSLKELLEEKLAGTTVSYPEFQAGITRLMEHGIVCRGDTQIETETYDTLDRIFSIVEDYFSIAGFKVRHSTDYKFIRLYPPKAAIPGESEEGDDDITPGMQQRISPDVVAALLALRILYKQANDLGKVDDDGEAESSLQALVMAMETQLRRPFPAQAADKRELMRQLRQLRVARFDINEIFDNENAPLLIRPMITGLVHEGSLDSIIEGADEDDQPENMNEPEQGQEDASL
jgi:hypothetical protein